MVMYGSSISLYEAANWGARLAGAALARKDDQGGLFIDGVLVESTQIVAQFSVLRCVDGRSCVVLTSFLRLVPDPRRTAPAVVLASDSSA